ncbi:helix-turn-helix domain-containing protein [Paraburkholderia strydomiana]
MENIQAEFGRLLKQRRKEAKLTQDELASRIGLGRTSVTNIELGRQPVSLQLLYELADAIGTDPVSLLPSRRRMSPLPADLESTLEKLKSPDEKRWAREFFAATEGRR